MADRLLFETRQAFRVWLSENCRRSDGAELLFGKKGGPKTLTLDEAQEEAVCFGWVDSVMHRIDEKIYCLHFSQRRSGCKWSALNKTLAEKMEREGRMTDCGREKIEEAKKNGQWDAQKPAKITDTEIDLLKSLLSSHEPAYTNFLAMSPSVQRTYTALYLDAKSEKTKITRLEKIIDRLDKNLKPM